MFRFICILILLTSLSSCKKDKALDPTLSIEASLEVSNIICFPYDTTSATVKLKITGGKQPYSIVWDNNSFTGEGPHSTVFKKTITHNITITDAKNLVKTYSYTLDRNNFDSLNYDYRNGIVGAYNGINYSGLLTMPTPTTYSWQYSSSPASYSVTKHSDFNSILISNTNLPFKSFDKSLKFTGYFAQCSFKSDSMFYNQQSSHGVWHSSFKGKKIN
jgi:hypothetical protein